MQACFQSASQNMLQHGAAVADTFVELHSYLATGAPLSKEWRLPSWLTPEIGSMLVALLLPLASLSTYHLYHDCGKPRCRTVDEDGRQHFPDHAHVSRQVWLEQGGSIEVGDLIGMDMDVHLLKADDIPEFAGRPQAASLLLTALAEIHANAAMFGGTESTSFKIKLKHIERRGKQIVQIMQNGPQ